jgi:hypothetical protein
VVKGDVVKKNVIKEDVINTNVVSEDVVKATVEGRTSRSGGSELTR